MSRRTVLAYLIALLAAPAPAAEPVTAERLLRTMTDPATVATFPDPPFTARQFSSYDRLRFAAHVPPGWSADRDRGNPLADGGLAARTPYFAKPGHAPLGFFEAGTRVGVRRADTIDNDHAWAYATGPDGGPVNGRVPQGFIARSAVTPDPQGYVLAEMDGPGCVVHLWSAEPQAAGLVRIYLDDNSEPFLRVMFSDLLSGRLGPWLWPYAGETGGGWGLYFPIPYARHCKICVDRPDVTYHVGYRTYPPGTAVETLTMDKLSRLLGPIEQVGTMLNFSDPYRTRRDVKPQRVPGKVLEPGGRWEFDVALPAGDGAAVRELRVRVRNSERIAAQLLGLVLTATFDGAAAPQVECPLGDFFGTASGVNRYRTLPLAVGFANFNPFNPPQYDPTDQVELTSRWRMPYRRSAHFAVRNTGRTPAEIVDAEVVAVPQPFAAGKTLHFHAGWQPGPVPKPPRDWELAKVEGSGVFAGVALGARDVAVAGWDSGGERITVDGEAFPSYFGTGVAHYFGCRGGDFRLFQQAYHARTRRDGPDNGEQTNMVRIHILDAIPFRKSLRFDFAGLYPEAGTAVTGGAVVYFYAGP